MKIPRGLGGKELAGLLQRYGYKKTRQTGSHIRLTTSLKGEHHITIPDHQPLKIGTLTGILGDIANHLEMQKAVLVNELFGEK